MATDPLTLDLILANSCYNDRPDTPFNPLTYDSSVKAEWREYRIETHCLAFIVIAKHNGDLTYTIKSYRVEDC